MNRLLAILAGCVSLGYCFLSFPDGATAILLTGVLSLAMAWTIKYVDDDVRFLIDIFVIALILRLLLGGAIYYFGLFEFFGPDARTYEYVGKLIADVWAGTGDASDPFTKRVMQTSGPGWGMNYFSGAIYWLAGSNLLVGQAVCAFFGAATSPLIYWCTKRIFLNRQAARYSAILVAVFPSMIVWSSQFLKDGLMIFFLVLSMTMVFEIQRRFNLLSVAILAFSLFSIFSLRFYIFYMVAVSVFGSFVVGLSTSTQAIFRRLIAVAVIGIALAFFGVFQSASSDFENFANIERFESSRKWASEVSGSGFAQSSDAKVTTAAGALTVLPIGLTYILLAPFPWQATNFRQAVTIPEILIWWSMIPLAIFGLIFAIKNRLKPAIPVLVFSSMLTIVYALFQGNVGTAYRQRTQIQVFLFMFISVGWVLMKERRENVQIERRRRREMFEASLKDRMGGPPPGDRN